MTDTPEHLKEYQLKLWLSKSPAERLRKMMIDNDAIFHFWNNTVKSKSTGELKLGVDKNDWPCKN